MAGRRSNQPYEPQFYPEMAPEWAKLLAQFLRFCERIRIASKDEGVVPLLLKPAQRYCIEEIFYGFSVGIHDFVILKARQLGISTVLWAFDLFWLTKFSLQGMYIADDEPNKEIHRSIIGDMYRSLVAGSPGWSRGPFKAHNRLESTWFDRGKWSASRFMWAFANRKKEGQLGRSRGANYIHAEEIDSWTDPDALASLEPAQSATHPRRAYFYVGTGQGYSLLYELWQQALAGHTSRPIFIGFWRNPDYWLTREQRTLWAAYGQPGWTPEEKEWAREVKGRYHVEISKGQLAWWRFTLAEGKGINGDQAKMMQEYPWFPDQSFQASGSQFLSGVTCLRLRTGLRHAPPASYYRYEWGPYFDSKGDDVLVEVPKEAATLTVYEQPQEFGCYIVAGDPAYGSSPEADRFAVTVWRAHPDQLIEVAKYVTPLGAMYQFAWVLAHLTGTYPPYLIHELNGPGMAVLQELDRMGEYGYGIANRGGTLQHVVSAIQHYLWKRADALQASYSREWVTSEARREEMFEQLRDSAERGALVVRSHDLTEELAALRRDSGRIEAGGVAHDDLAVTAAMANRQWLDQVIQEIENYVAPAAVDPRGPRDVTEKALSDFFQRMRQGDTDMGRMPKNWGVEGGRPGR